MEHDLRNLSNTVFKNKWEISFGLVYVKPFACVREMPEYFPSFYFCFLISILVWNLSKDEHTGSSVCNGLIWFCILKQFISRMPVILKLDDLIRYSTSRSWVVASPTPPANYDWPVPVVQLFTPTYNSFSLKYDLFSPRYWLGITPDWLAGFCCADKLHQAKHCSVLV